MRKGDLLLEMRWYTRKHLKDGCVRKRSVNLCVTTQAWDISESRKVIIKVQTNEAVLTSLKGKTTISHRKGAESLGNFGKDVVQEVLCLRSNEQRLF